ncbi:hypothetical protein SGPA1_10944 [Streptomyces misionensis JCM 4497]
MEVACVDTGILPGAAGLGRFHSMHESSQSDKVLSEEMHSLCRVSGGADVDSGASCGHW